ncbi:hypothetical protein V8G54_026321, partial [Vigna mungo]
PKPPSPTPVTHHSEHHSQTNLYHHLRPSRQQQSRTTQPETTPAAPNQPAHSFRGSPSITESETTPTFEVLPPPRTREPNLVEKMEPDTPTPCENVDLDTSLMEV